MNQPEIIHYYVITTVSEIFHILNDTTGDTQVCNIVVHVFCPVSVVTIATSQVKMHQNDFI